MTENELLDALCSKRLLSLEQEFDFIVSDTDFNFADLLNPSSNKQPQVSVSSSVSSCTCVPKLEPNPPQQTSSHFTSSKSDKEVTAVIATGVPKETTTWARNVERMDFKL